MDRTAPLSQTQRMALLNLIKERDSIVNNKSTAPGIIEAKKRTWEEIVLKFNALNPDQQPRSSKQLKRSYDHVKRKVKDEDREFKKKIKVTGGGCPPTPPKATEEIALAASMMTVDLAMGNDVFETFNVEPVHNSSAADVYELQEEVVDDPGVPGHSRNGLRHLQLLAGFPPIRGTQTPPPRVRRLSNKAECVLVASREQSIHTASLLGSLVVSDIFTVTFLLVFDLPHLWNDHFSWLLGAATCRVAAFLQAAAILANSAALVAISVDRHLAIVYAHRQFGSEWRSTHIIVFLIFLLLFSFGVSSPYIAFYELDGPYLGYSLLNNHTLHYFTCPDYFCLSLSPYLQPFQIALVCVIFLPMLVIFCVCYLGLIQFLRHKPIVGTAERRQRAKKRKVLVTLSCVTVTFLVCRLPSWLLLLVPQPHNQFHTSRRLALSYTHFSLHSLTLLAPALNPFLYALFQQSYRHHLLGCCGCFYCSSPAEPIARKEVLPATTTTNTITTQPSNATFSSGPHTL
ncbi:hypothetical protein Pcinc_005980 [Petrolisthes cinctipes]|uniref:Regulatory protein zeste n=1 Tax=Petrolisthes cinctipes TaxID=88211 RepID=A0AAE1L216_PETCI|nr:hypothetical protein Pcinc_005980 [Petrolisthes cinctipes]